MDWRLQSSQVHVHLGHEGVRQHDARGAALGGLRAEHTPDNNLFGGQSSATSFGGFGQSAPASQSTFSFGQPSSSSLFGQPASQLLFGQQSSSSLFGNSRSASFSSFSSQTSPQSQSAFGAGTGSSNSFSGFGSFAQSQPSNAASSSSFGAFSFAQSQPQQQQSMSFGSFSSQSFQRQQQLNSQQPLSTYQPRIDESRQLHPLPSPALRFGCWSSESNDDTVRSELSNSYPLGDSLSSMS